MKQLLPKRFEFQAINGLTINQLNQHYFLYKGYINKVNLLRKEISDTVEINKNTYKKKKMLKINEGCILNGVKLHELYFENLGCKGIGPQGYIKDLIERDFGGISQWEKDFYECAQLAKGWLVLALDLDDFSLNNCICDSHEIGGIWKAIPLLVLDIYEHAYMIDFGINKTAYIDIFMKNINWMIVNERMNNYYSAYPYTGFKIL